MIRQEDEVVCGCCKRTYPVVNDVVVFNAGEPYYWGELEQEAIEMLLSAKGDIETVISDAFDGLDNRLAEYLRHYSGSEARAAWRIYSKGPKYGAFLDIGCGWGAISLALASQYERGFVLDVCPERVGLVLRRAAERGNKINGCSIQAWPALPFAEDSFDLVVLNGVMEWVPDAVRKKKPEQVQQDLLREIARILKPEGELYIGIENRYGYHYFLGKKEEHTKLPWISLLPRFLGNLYHRMFHKKDYRAYTHSHRKLQSMLNKAGLYNQRWFYPYPDYREFDRIVDLESPCIIKHTFVSQRPAAKLMKRVATSMNLWKPFADSYGVFASARKSGSCLVESLVELIKAKEQLSNMELQKTIITNSGLALVHMGSSADGYLLTIPITQRAGMRLNREKDVLIGMKNDNLCCGLPEIPEPAWLLAGEIHAKYEKTSPSLQRGGVPDSQVISWLSSFQEKTLKKSEVFVTDIVFAIKALAPFTGKDEYTQMLREMAHNQTSTCRVHGDFHENNLLVENGRIWRVIDWDLSRQAAPPVWDLISYLLEKELRKNKSWLEAFEGSVDRIISKKDKCFEEYLNLFSKDDICVAIQLFPSCIIWQKETYGDRYIRPVLDAVPWILKNFPYESKAQCPI